jgi:hypothetical protein
MSPDRLRAWIKKRKTGAVQLVLAHEQGLGVRANVATWSREEVEHAEDPTQGASDVVAAIFDAAQDHTDGQNQGKCTFLLSWQTDGGRILSSTPMYCECSDKEAKPATSDVISTQALIGQLLGHIHDQQKVINGSLGIVLGGQKSTIEGMQATVNMIAAENLDLRRQLQQREEPRQLTAEDLESSKLKLEAMKKLVDMGPDVLKLGLAALARWIGSSSGEGSGVGTNGAGHA